ncbi:hypothetical protein LIER_16056 [Lithospermum erythrorhizon]|uniref:Uncharacterized protein n=1 Tax=Lithospermum erythrorhizon TaxID=34254 RepID=A0AAV3Q9C2_LITER
MTIRLEERYHDFMYGLNRELYGSVRSALNTQEPLPSLDTSYQKIREQESLWKASDNTVGNVFVAFSLRSNPRMGNYVDKSKLWCNHCKKQGHDSPTYFLKVGYLEWWETRNRRGARSGAATSIHRGAALHAVVAECGLLGGRPAGFPMVPNHKLGKSTNEYLADGEQYCRLVGRFLYLSYTRPDLAYAVHLLSQFLQKPRQDHWDAALWVVRYLKNGPGQGILLRSDSDFYNYARCDNCCNNSFTSFS